MSEQEKYAFIALMIRGAPDLRPCANESVDASRGVGDADPHDD
jgi:hypothetical protein